MFNSQISTHLLESDFQHLEFYISRMFESASCQYPQFLTTQEKWDIAFDARRTLEWLSLYEKEFGSDAMLNIYPELQQHLDYLGVTLDTGVFNV